MSKIPAYIDFIEENLDYVMVLQAEIEHWERVYKHRAFQHKWPQDIQDIINILKAGIDKNLNDCKYYLNRIEEIRKDEQTCGAQSILDQENVGIEGQGAGDTTKDSSKSELEDLGVASQEANHNRGEDIKL